jgi:hypothetical protein
VLRGRPVADGRATLLTVDWQTTADTVRLLRSWRRFCDGPAVVVENGTLADRRRVSRSAPWAKVVGGIANLGHGLGLDYGLRFVRTEYVVICDPDSIITSASFLPVVLALARENGVASIDLGRPWYSPMCLAFPTALWKESQLSMEQHWPDYDVAGALTARVGGLHLRGLLPVTREPHGTLTSRPRVYADVFSNTVGTARVHNGPAAFDPAEGEYADIVAGQEQWRDWADRFVDGRATLDDFPVA